MNHCATRDCPRPSRLAIQTWTSGKSTIWYDDRDAPKAAARYCRTHGAELASGLVLTLVDEDGGDE